MPRTVDLTVPAERTHDLLEQLRAHDQVLSVRVFRGASVAPPGDVLSFEILDTSLSWAMRLADDVGLGVGPGAFLTSSRPESVTSAGSAGVDRDRSTSSWEEVQMTIGRESTMTPPKLLVMFLAEIFAAVGLHTAALRVSLASVKGPGSCHDLGTTSVGS
jgi:hypothetical protein